MGNLGSALRNALLLLAVTITVFLISCGGGGGSSAGAPPPPPPPSFSIALTPATISLPAGETSTVTLSVTPTNGFNERIDVAVSGLPTGVTISPTSPFSVTNTGQVITLTTASSAPTANATVQFSASSGSLKSNANLALTVSPGAPGAANDRTSFVRTDDTPLAVVYDPTHQLLFASAVHLNCVAVISISSQQVTRCIPVSGALGLSLSADGSELLVGTQTGVVARIDTGSLRVVRRDVVPQVQSSATPQFLTVGQAYEAANRKVLLFSNWGYADLFGNFESSSAVEWDPATGTATLRPEAGGGGLIAMSADHSKILIAGQGQPTLYDSTTDTFTAVPGVQGVYEPAMNPSGTQFALLDGTPLIQFFNAQMQVVGSLDLAICCGFRPSGAVYSSDGKLFYVVLPNPLPVLVTVDATTFQVVGTAPAYISTLAYFSSPSIVGHPQAVDSTGLVFEIADHGVAINDANDVHDLSNASALSDFIIATPDDGPVGQTTTTQFSTETFTSIPDVFFGFQRGLNPHVDASTNQLVATAPSASATGPVNVKVIDSQGRTAIIPQGFTYGSVSLTYGSIAAAPQGGAIADLFGYGLGIDVSGGTTQAAIGGNSANVVRHVLLPAEIPYPFPAQHLAVAVPAGLPGMHDVTVSSSVGTATFAKNFHYVSAVTDYSSTDAFLYILYDPHRDRVYLSAGDHIDVFSVSSKSFGIPITVPTVGGTRSLAGLALTPDGSKLLAANVTDQSVAILDPDNPASGAVAVALPLNGLTASPGPFEIAATATGHAFVTTTVFNTVSGCCASIYDINLATLQVSTANLPSGSLISLNNTYIAGSADGNTVVVATSNSSAGPVLSWQATSGLWDLKLFQEQFLIDAAISGDGNLLAVGSDPDISNFPFPYLLNPQLDVTAQVNNPEFLAVQDGPSLQLDQSGALLYAVTGSGFDILDGRSGQLRERVLLTEAVQFGPTLVASTPSKTISITPAGDKAFLITNAGLTVVELDSVPLGIGSVTPAAGAPGATVTVRGSGFVNGTTVTVNGISAATTFIDSSTLMVTIPASVSAGGAQFSLTNPDGSHYSVDAAYAVQ